MKKIGNWYLPDVDTYFSAILETEDSFEASHIWAALEYVDVWGTAVDGGACVGFWTVELAKKFDKVVAFEPAIDSFECLKINTGLYPNVESHQKALGDKVGKCSLRMSSIRPGNIGSRFVTQGNEIDMVRLDDYTYERLGLIKLDLEGYEFPCLASAEHTLLKHKPVVVIEEKRFKDREGRLDVDVKAAGSFLRGLGMKEAVRMGNDLVYIWDK